MDYDLTAHLQNIYNTYPENKSQPIIGITMNFADKDAKLREVYYKQVVAAGATPLLIPPIADKAAIINTLEHIDGLILSGGADINPLWAGEEPIKELQNINAKRDLAELLITQLAFNRQIPILGICRGMQTLAIALGGKVQQDIYKDYLPVTSTNPSGGETEIENHSLRPATLKHLQDAPFTEATHSISILPGTILKEVYEHETIYVNSFHHQAVKATGKRFKPTAFAADGVIEAMESNEYKAVMGVQWHPEWMEDEGQKLFKWLANEAAQFARTKALHRRILTFDSHCDTPMFFPQGVDFGKRDPRILYDLHKMTEGKQNAVTMVAYLPQPRMGEVFSEKINLDGLKHFNPEHKAVLEHITPASYTDFIFDKIENIVQEHQQYLSIARTPNDLYTDKRESRHSIMLAIENGLALEGKLENVRHFAKRGITYITLCHNGDNDICDSARGSNTHGGVSQFGATVIEEMNRCGVMVDLSHGGEKSFYDALEISQQPIVCSHSNCKSLCDVPRNLTDEQLRALARAGGVAQITFYKGFLVKGREANVLDAIAHLEHAVRLMGIDHVGIGTDFDGDGTIIGVSDASEMINFTRHLLRKRFSEHDIEKIWGGNWLRVMTQVQAARK